MRTKVLLLAAALGTAGVATSMAQVYSANAVGYVNVSLPMGLSIIANPLNGADNDLNTILPLDDSAVGAVVFRFNEEDQAYYDAITFLGSFGVPPGWQVGGADPADTKVIDPGEAFFISTLAPLDVTFVGEVPQGELSNPVPGNFALSMRSSQVPQEGALGHAADGTGPASGLEFPAGTGDSVFVFENGGFGDASTYIESLGWSSDGVNFDDGPVIPVAGGFFVQKLGGDSDWARSFTVN